MKENSTIYRRKWILWLRWVGAVCGLLASIAMIKVLHDYLAVKWLLLIVMTACAFRYKPIKQRFIVLINGQEVEIEISLDLFGKIWSSWHSKSNAGQTYIARYSGASVWLDFNISIDEAVYNLRLHVRRFPEGFLVGGAGRGFDFKLLDDRFVL